MNKTLTNTVMAGWIGIVGLGEMGKSATVEANDANLKIAVHIRNYAHIDQNVLDRAGKIAAGIFQKAGVETVVAVKSPEGSNAVDATLPRLAQLYVDFPTQEMGARLGLPANVLGLAPGTSDELDRIRVYVFDYIAEELARKQEDANKAKILGHAIAHEIGHILLHMAGHSHKGIMQANWQQKDFRAMTVGGLDFDSEQAAGIQAEVARRNQQQAAVELAALR